MDNQASISVELPAATNASAKASVQPTGCCPPFDPEPFRDAEITWIDELFVKEHALAFYHVPLNLRSRVTRAHARIEQAGAVPERPLMLSDEHSPWGTDLYIRVSKPVSGAETVKLPGTYLTRVYEGPYSDARKWAKDMRAFVAQRGKSLERSYFAYTTCPACAKAYGKNYVVAFAKVR